MARSLVINTWLQIPGKELTLTFARSAGPGGQNVNKVNSKAVLRWNVVSSTVLAEGPKGRFLKRYATRVTQHGDVILTSEKERDQPRNIADCYEKLRQMVLPILVAERPRKKTRPSRGSVERRLQSKQKSSQRKKQRRYRPGSDD